MGKSWSWDSQTNILVKNQAEYKNEESNMLWHKQYFRLLIILVVISTSKAKNHSDKLINEWPEQPFI